MPEFLELLPPPEALKRLLEHLPGRVAPEEIETSLALGRVTAAPITAPQPLPSFPRATVDGFAVRAADTFGASDSLPAYLQVVGEIPMGVQPEIVLAPAQSALVHTGGMLPDGADAVVMVEHTQSVRPGEVEVMRAVAVGENVLKVGEDVAAGEQVIPAGVRLRPAEIGGLMAMGIVRVSVARQPRIGILSSGDEVVPPESAPLPGQVRDVNAFTLSALVVSAGGMPVRYGIVPDREEAMRQVAGRALAECEAVVVTAGSSASARDLTAQVINTLGSPGVLVHGVNVRPGKPTILAVCDGKAVIGLPGNPVSALVIAWLFITPVIETLLGLRQRRQLPGVPARLAVNLASQAGREDWIPVRLLPTAEGYLADPIFSKSNLIFSLVRADGLVRIPADATGLAAGEFVSVVLF
jgi:molybdopterin molybdotransferase